MTLEFKPADPDLDLDAFLRGSQLLVTQTEQVGVFQQTLTLPNVVIRVRTYRSPTMPDPK